MRWPALVVLAIAVGSFPAVADDETKKPPVPAGTDPGGFAVAVIETGIDYTITSVAERLARDGEGEIVGWDFIDNDRRPYKRTDDLEDMHYTHRGTAMARMVVKRAARARIAPVAIATDDEVQVRQAIAFVDHTPAKVAVMALGRSAAALWSALRDGMEQSRSGFLLVVAAGEDEGDRSRIKEHLAPKLDDLDNVIVVTACDHGGHVLTTAADAVTNADVAVNTEAFSAELLSADSFSYKPEASIAAAEIAAMAVRLLTQDSSLSAAQLKTAILAKTKPLPEASSGLAKAGYIAEPWQQFRVQ